MTGHKVVVCCYEAHLLRCLSANQQCEVFLNNYKFYLVLGPILSCRFEFRFLCCLDRVAIPCLQSCCAWFQLLSCGMLASDDINSRSVVHLDGYLLSINFQLSVDCARFLAVDDKNIIFFTTFYL